MDIFAAGTLLAFICVGVHYEALSLATSLLRRLKVFHRGRVVMGLIAALAAHVSEVLVFAVGWLVLTRTGYAVFNIADPNFSDHFYFSFTTYTSLGYGDVIPLGPARLLAGLESLVGLVLIAWTASFTYFEMRLYWDDQPDEEAPPDLEGRVKPLH